MIDNMSLLFDTPAKITLAIYRRIPISVGSKVSESVQAMYQHEINTMMVHILHGWPQR